MRKKEEKKGLRRKGEKKEMRGRMKRQESGKDRQKAAGVWLPALAGRAGKTRPHRGVSVFWSGR